MRCTLRGMMVLGVVLVGTSVLTGCESLGLGGGEMDEVGALVKVQPVANGIVERSLELSGTVDAGRSVRLVPDMPGKVKSLPVQVGSEVKKGALLARLDTDMARLQLDQAEAMVRLAELGLETADREFGRAERLHASGTLTDQQFDQAQSGMEMAEQQLAQATAAKGLASEQVSGGVLRAPFDGVVTQVGCEEGEYFNPMGMSATGGAPVLIALVNLETLRVDLQASDQDVGLLREGMGARIFVDALGAELATEGVTGTVEFIGLAADPMSRTFPVRIVADNPEKIVRAGMHARVRLVLESREQALHVPAESIRVADGQDYVMVAHENRARRTPVEVGMAGDQGTEIVSGLQGSETVIVEGNFGLPDGALVEVVQ